MAFGNFTLTGQFFGLDGATPAVGRVQIDGIPQVIIDTSANKIRVGPRTVVLDAQGSFSISLPSDATTGNSTSIAFRVTPTLKHQNLTPTEFYARPINATVDLKSITTQQIVGLTPTAVSTTDFTTFQAALPNTYAAYVVHGANAATARPSVPATAPVLWIGTVLPVNMGINDQWFDRSAADTTAPTVPTPTAVMSGANVALTFAGSTDAVGVTGYKVYRSATTGFTPGAGNLLATTSTASYTDTAPLTGVSYYKVSAIDAAGNESAPSAQATPFNPLAVPWHTAVWADLEAAANGTTMDTLTDRSGNARHMAPEGGTASRKPTLVTADTVLNSRPAYAFDGVDDVMVTPTFTNVAQPWSFVLVGERTRTTVGAVTALLAAYGFDVDSAANRSGAIQIGTNHIYNMNDGTDVAGGTDDKFIMVGTFGGATSSFTVNGVTTTGSTGSGAHNAARWMLGGSFSNNWYGNVRIAFAGFIAGTLTTNQITALTDGAKHRYGF